jgi:hypothetical protein
MGHPMPLTFSKFIDLIGGAGLWPAKSVFEPTLAQGSVAEGKTNATTNGGMAGPEALSTFI